MRSHRQPHVKRPISRPFQKWDLAALEPRLLMASDCAAVVADAASSSLTTDTSTESVEPESLHLPAEAHGGHLVILDHAISPDPTWQQAVPANAEIVVLYPGIDAVAQITQILEGRRSVESVHLISHGRSGEIVLAGQCIDHQTLVARAREFQAWGKCLAPHADMIVYGCDVASGEQGKQFVDRLSRLIQCDIAASHDRTGAKRYDANWEWEYATGEIEYGDLLCSRSLDAYRGHLGIEIWAAGSTGDELMELQIGDEVVATWFVRGTDAEAGRFYPYTFNRDGVSLDEIRINFVNDLYDPANNVDRNLRVDKIIVDGTIYETESPSVYSTASWKDEDGFVPGYRESEYLHANGHFQFAGPGTTIEIFAQGDTGNEAVQLQIDGVAVQTHYDISRELTAYTYFTRETISVDRVRVAFINSLYKPEVNYDQNLRVDRITINGETFHSEAASTYSTGTYVNGRGIVPGNWQTEYLHADGYFQYSGNGPGTPGSDPQAGSFSLVTGQITALESQGTLVFEVARLGGSRGTASIDIFTASDTAFGGEDYVTSSQRLVFADGETRKQFTVTLVNDATSEGTEQFSVRLDNPIGANLLAPRTTLVTILDDDAGLPAFSSFSSSAGLTLNGSASVTAGSLQLTGTAVRQTGSAFYRTPIAVNGSTSFRSSFAFTIGGGSGTNGADGFAFVLQNSSRGFNALGNAGGFLGYDTIGNSLAIEFDTYRNAGDISGNSVAVVINGATRNALTQVNAPFDLNNGTRYFAWVDYNGSTETLAVYLSTSPEQPVFALLKTQIQLDSIVGNSAYLGFTAGNFDAPNFHRISAWSFTLDTPSGDPPLNPTGAISERNLISGLTQPLAIDWSPDGRNMYIAEKGGVIKVARDGSSNPTVLLDISRQVNDVQDRGLLDFALHPDFQSNGYLYLLYTYDPPEVYNFLNDANAGPDGRGNRAGRLMRVQADASTGFTTIVAGSETILLGKNSTWQNFNGFIDSTVNLSAPQAGFSAAVGYLQDFINSDSRSHTVGSLAFSRDGSLFVSIGDGASFNQTDRRALRVQSLNSLSGKVLRIDPLTGRGLSDNPFFDGNPDSNRSKVYQLGLRNPWRLTVDPRSGRLYIGDTGLSSFEEINTGPAGTNFGWPYYEGGQGVNVRTPGYSNLPEAQDFYRNGTATPGAIALAHQGGSNTVVLGDVLINGDLGLQYEGSLFFNDLYRGIVRFAKVGANGQLTDVQTFVTGAEFVVDIQQGPDGSLYYVNLVEGTVGKWRVG